MSTEDEQPGDAIAGGSALPEDNDIESQSSSIVSDISHAGSSGEDLDDGAGPAAGFAGSSGSISMSETTHTGTCRLRRLNNVACQTDYCDEFPVPPLPPSPPQIDLAPDAESSCQVGDEATEGVLQLVINNFGTMTETRRGESKRIQGVCWRIMAMPRQHPVAKKGTQKCLGFFLQCLPNKYSEFSAWSCLAGAELRLISQATDRTPHFTRKTTHTYTPKENDWGYSCFMTWADIMDESQGYIKNDTIILEVTVKADPAKNILSHADFLRNVQNWLDLAMMQFKRGSIDLAIEANGQAIKFCTDKDPDSRARLDSQKKYFIDQKLMDSINRIEKGKNKSPKTDDCHSHSALKQAMQAGSKLIKGGKQDKNKKAKKTAVRTPSPKVQQAPAVVNQTPKTETATAVKNSNGAKTTTTGNQNSQSAPVGKPAGNGAPLGDGTPSQTRKCGHNHSGNCGGGNGRKGNGNQDSQPANGHYAETPTQNPKKKTQNKAVTSNADEPSGSQQVYVDPLLDWISTGHFSANTYMTLMPMQNAWMRRSKPEDEMYVSLARHLDEFQLHDSLAMLDGEDSREKEEIIYRYMAEHLYKSCGAQDITDPQERRDFFTEQRIHDLAQGAFDVELGRQDLILKACRNAEAFYRQYCLDNPVGAPEEPLSAEVQELVKMAKLPRLPDDNELKRYMIIDRNARLLDAKIRLLWLDDDVYSNSSMCSSSSDSDRQYDGSIKPKRSKIEHSALCAIDTCPCCYEKAQSFIPMCDFGVQTEVSSSSRLLTKQNSRPVVNQGNTDTTTAPANPVTAGRTLKKAKKNQARSMAAAAVAKLDEAHAEMTRANALAAAGLAIVAPLLNDQQSIPMITHNQLNQMQYPNFLSHPMPTSCQVLNAAAQLHFQQPDPNIHPDLYRLEQARLQQFAQASQIAQLQQATRNAAANLTIPPANNNPALKPITVSSPTASKTTKPGQSNSGSQATTKKTPDQSKPAKSSMTQTGASAIHSTPGVSGTMKMAPPIPMQHLDGMPSSIAAMSNMASQFPSMIPMELAMRANPYPEGTPEHEVGTQPVYVESANKLSKKYHTASRIVGMNYLNTRGVCDEVDYIGNIASTSAANNPSKTNINKLCHLAGINCSQANRKSSVNHIKPMYTDVATPNDLAGCYNFVYTGIGDEKDYMLVNQLEYLRTMREELAKYDMLDPEDSKRFTQATNILEGRLNAGLKENKEIQKRAEEAEMKLAKLEKVEKQVRTELNNAKGHLTEEKEKNAILTKDMRDKNKDIKKLENNLTTVRKEKDEFQDKAKQLHKELIQVQKKLSDDTVKLRKDLTNAVDNRKQLTAELSTRDSEVKSLTSQLEERIAKMKKTAHEMEQEKQRTASAKQAVEKALARAKKAEIGVLQAQLAAGMTLLDQARFESCEHSNMMQDAAAALAANPEAASIYIASKHEWEGVIEEIDDYIRRAKDDFNGLVKLIEEGKALSDIDPLLVSKPPQPPKVLEVMALDALVATSSENSSEPDSDRCSDSIVPSAGVIGSRPIGRQENSLSPSSRAPGSPMLKNSSSASPTHDRPRVYAGIMVHELLRELPATTCEVLLPANVNIIVNTPNAAAAISALGPLGLVEEVLFDWNFHEPVPSNSNDAYGTSKIDQNGWDESTNTWSTTPHPTSVNTVTKSILSGYIHPWTQKEIPEPISARQHHYITSVWPIYMKVVQSKMNTEEEFAILFSASFVREARTHILRFRPQDFAEAVYMKRIHDSTGRLPPGAAPGYLSNPLGPLESLFSTTSLTSVVNSQDALFNSTFGSVLGELPMSASNISPPQPSNRHHNGGINLNADLHAPMNSFPALNAVVNSVTHNLNTTLNSPLTSDFHTQPRSHLGMERHHYDMNSKMRQQFDGIFGNEMPLNSNLNGHTNNHNNGMSPFPGHPHHYQNGYHPPQQSNGQNHGPHQPPHGYNPHGRVYNNHHNQAPHQGQAPNGQHQRPSPFAPNLWSNAMM